MHAHLYTRIIIIIHKVTCVYMYELKCMRVLLFCVSFYFLCFCLNIFYGCLLISGKKRKITKNTQGNALTFWPETQFNITH